MAAFFCFATYKFEAIASARDALAYAFCIFA